MSALEKTTSQQNLLDLVIQRILEVVQPSRVVLFGSTARGGMTPDSDFDLLVIVPGQVHRRRLEQQIYLNLVGVGAPVDVIVATEQDIEDFGSQVGMIYRPALREGQVVYESLGFPCSSSCLVAASQEQPQSGSRRSED